MLSFHTIVLICCKTINYLIIQYLYGYFSATIKNVWSELSGAFIASCCGDSRRVQFTKKINNNNDDLRNFIGSLDILGFLWSLVNRFIDLLIYCASRSPEVISIYKQLCIIKIQILNVNTCFLVYESIAFSPLKLDYLATVMFV